MARWAVEITEQYNFRKDLLTGYLVEAETAQEARRLAVEEHTRGLQEYKDLIVATHVEPEVEPVVRTFACQVPKTRKVARG